MLCWSQACSRGLQAKAMACRGECGRLFGGETALSYSRLWVQFSSLSEQLWSSKAHSCQRVFFSSILHIFLGFIFLDFPDFPGIFVTNEWNLTLLGFFFGSKEFHELWQNASASWYIFPITSKLGKLCGGKKSLTWEWALHRGTALLSRFSNLGEGIFRDVFDLKIA